MAKTINKPRILIMRGRKEYIEDLNRHVNVVKQESFFVEDTSKDFHTKYGAIKSSDLKKKDGSVIMSSRKKPFVIFTPSSIDIFARMKRSAQLVTIKDAAVIAAYTGIGPKSKVVDAGAGSGGLACYLARFTSEVITYDIRDDHISLVEKNKQLLGLKNLKVRKGDVYDRIDEKDADLITLDLPEPWKALKNAYKALKIGGFIAVYNPCITQISQFCDEMKKEDGLMLLKTIELVERRWAVDGNKVRPKSGGIGHTGFLCFARKIS